MLLMGRATALYGTSPIRFPFRIGNRIATLSGSPAFFEGIGCGTVPRSDAWTLHGLAIAGGLYLIQLKTVAQ